MRSEMIRYGEMTMAGTKKKIVRRHALGLIATSVAGAALASRLPIANVAYRERNTDRRKITVGYNRGTHPLLMAAATNFLTQLKAHVLIADFELHELSDTLLICSVQSGQLDAAISSSAYLRNRPDQAHVLGSLPIGLGCEQKLSWLESKVGLEHQRRFFGDLFGVQSDLIYMAGDSFGFFADRPLSSIKELAGRKVASLNLRRRWWESAGAVAVDVSPHRAQEMFFSGELDISPLFAHEAHTSHKDRMEPGIRPYFYYPTSSFTSSPTGHLVWNENVYREISPLSPERYQQLRSATVRESIQAREEQNTLNLCEIGRVACLCRLPSDFEASLKSFNRRLIGRLIESGRLPMIDVPDSLKST